MAGYSPDRKVSSDDVKRVISGATTVTDKNSGRTPVILSTHQENLQPYNKVTNTVTGQSKTYLYEY